MQAKAGTARSTFYDCGVMQASLRPECPKLGLERPLLSREEPKGTSLVSVCRLRRAVGTTENASRGIVEEADSHRSSRPPESTLVSLDCPRLRPSSRPSCLDDASCGARRADDVDVLLTRG